MSGEYSGPPIRLNRGFLENKYNKLKILEIFLGIASAVFNSYCYPNDLYLYCTYRIHAFPQIFSVICVNVFFIILTVLLAFCDLCGVTDAYYKYNFPLLEKFLTSLATILYAVSSLLVFVAVLTSEFSTPWLLPMLFTFWTCACYGYETYLRWQADDRY